ncbi:hypothetical protein FRC17_000465 [Serendipita sp. 399]|nr:hypothetical protein FRC17_000465 [Serendipita sp. 399]
MHGAGGLVCGIEESTKFNTLTNLLTSSWSAAADQSTPKELLCFTAENGSLGLVASLNAAAQATNIEPEIIVLTPSWNVERLKESLSHHKNVVALPLLIHRLDVQHDDMYYLHTIYGKDHYLHRENQPTGLPSGTTLT